MSQASYYYLQHKWCMNRKPGSQTVFVALVVGPDRDSAEGAAGFTEEMAREGSGTCFPLFPGPPVKGALSAQMYAGACIALPPFVCSSNSNSPGEDNSIMGCQTQSVVHTEKVTLYSDCSLSFLWGELWELTFEGGSVSSCEQLHPSNLIGNKIKPVACDASRPTRRGGGMGSEKPALFWPNSI